MTIGNGAPLTVIAGPCAVEDDATNRAIVEAMRGACARLGLQYVFKASFDKANRTSVHSNRGPGLESGLEALVRIRDEFGIPVTTDVHQPEQAGAVAKGADLLQLPAFLCRQTDLLLACARTGRPVNVKKGQFLSPAEMTHVVTKLREGGCEQIILTERGTFFGYHRLVNDFIGLHDLMHLGAPVCFDITHSTQLPGGDAAATAGRPECAPLLARAAVAAGVDAIFLECHPDPSKGLSDRSTMLDLDAATRLLEDAAAVRQAIDRSGSIAGQSSGV